MSEMTSIVFMSYGVILQEILDDGLLSRYRVIVIDDVHERTLEMDLTLALIRKIIKKRKDLKVLICSATLNAQQMQGTL
jgi:HrpA-like RNA helicase